MDKAKNMLTMMSPKEYSMALFEFWSVTSALIMSAKKLVKKITRLPCSRHASGFGRHSEGSHPRQRD